LFKATNIEQIDFDILIKYESIIFIKDVNNQPRTTNFPEFASLMKTGPPTIITS